jgi:phasin family protein
VLEFSLEFEKPHEEMNMSETTFDPKSIFDSYKSAFAPALKAQQEGVKALDRVGRYQYAVAGDYLEWSLAQAKAAIGAQTPAEFVSKQVELTTALSEKLRARAQEFVKLATDAQTGFGDVVSDTVTKIAAETKKKAS